MNKIFRVIFSQATQSWVAVSELTKAHKKQSASHGDGTSAFSFSGIFKISALSVALMSALGINSANAAITEGASSYNGIAIGDGSTAQGNGVNNPGHGIAIGVNANAT